MATQLKHVAKKVVETSYSVVSVLDTKVNKVLLSIIETEGAMIVATPIVEETVRNVIRVNQTPLVMHAESIATMVGLGVGFIVTIPIAYLETTADLRLLKFALEKARRKLD